MYNKQNNAVDTESEIVVSYTIKRLQIKIKGSTHRQNTGQDPHGWILGGVLMPPDFLSSLATLVAFLGGIDGSLDRSRLLREGKSRDT